MGFYAGVGWWWVGCLLGLGKVKASVVCLAWGLGTYPACELLQELASFLAMGQETGNGFNDSGPFCLR